ncbi:MAG: hypothetical protein P4M11_08595 [Candidatus Pacebacteria bacterium]|nr:hypothetical protein [Candidatus Paceibacterota bacterium]
MQPGEGDSKKLYYVPLSIKMILSAQGDECKIDGSEVKSVSYTVSHVGVGDNSGTGGATLREGAEPDALPH